MNQHFDQPLDRRPSHATKWQKYAGRDILPFWIADMDFAAPELVLEAIRTRLQHPILGYTDRPETIETAFTQWLHRRFEWQVPTEWLIWLPGVVPGLNLAAQSLPQASRLMIPTPVYYPFLSLGHNANLPVLEVAMHCVDNRWQFDFSAMQAAITPDTKLLAICNPQNPTARCYTASELHQLADFVVQHDLLLAVDEIHCDLVLNPDARHVPIAQLRPDIASRCITLYAATKVYNIPGLSCAVAVVPDADLRERLLQQRRGLVPGIGPLEYAASEAAFNDEGNWIAELIKYLQENLAMLKSCVGQRMTQHDATYLGWIDVRDMQLENVDAHFERFGIGLSDGAQFGLEGFVRFNFACPRSLLEQGLTRLEQALG